MSVPGKAFSFQEATCILEGKSPLPLLVGDVAGAVQKATRILYLADNSGEIGFDSLLITAVKEMGATVNLVMKKDPFFEDATIKDAHFFSMDKLVDNIFTVNGFFIPGRTKSRLSDIFKKSDLVIAKGTGNYEALRGEFQGKRVIYLLKVKCKPISADISVPVGTFVVKAEQ